MKRSVLILLIASSLQADDNHIHIDQSGANMQMEIDQIAEHLISADLSSSARDVLNKSNNTIIGKLSAILSLPEFQMT